MNESRGKPQAMFLPKLQSTCRYTTRRGILLQNCYNYIYFRLIFGNWAQGKAGFYHAEESATFGGSGQTGGGSPSVLLTSFTC